MNYPKSFIDLVESLKKLPGVGDKSAERYVYAINCIDSEEITAFAQHLVDFKKNMRTCNICGQLTDKEICSVCSSKSRDNSIICIVEDSKSVFTFEKAGNYNGLYHVLGGLISPIDEINPSDLNIASLINNRITDEVKEIIIALSPSIEGETTSLYLQKILEKTNIKISRLSYGIPMGLDMDYLDPIMITKALEDRKYVS